MFNSYRFKKKRGLTLIEVILVLALVGIVISTATPMLTFSIKAQSTVAEEYQIQSQVRLTSQVISNFIKDSSAIFMLNELQFDSTNLEDEWDYFSLSPDKTQIIQYKWDSATNSHIENVLADSSPGLIYSLSFNKSKDDSLLGGFSLRAVGESGNVKAAIDNEIGALNSVVVDNTGNMANPAVALAYRTHDIPDPSKPRISVTLVLDKSGSMAKGLNGGNLTGGYSNVNSRLSIMKARTKDLINELERIGNVHVAVVPFDTNANKISGNNFHNLYDISSYKNIIVNNVDNIDEALGGTNVGDGMRRAYYIHAGFKSTYAGTGDLLHYNIQLMDGNPTYWSRYDYGSRNFYYDSQNIGSSSDTEIGGNGQEENDNMTNSMKYVEGVGDTLYVMGDTEIKTFIIGFSAQTGSIDRLSAIAGYVTSPTNDRIVGTYYEAASSEALEEVYRDISKKIEMDAWHIFGPNN